MKHLLVIAHGSRRQESNDEIRLLGERIAAMNHHGFDGVHCAFLELADPSIPDGIRHCAAQGASEIVIMPYFLSAGRHVSEDIPREVDLTRQEFPDVRIHIARYLGSIDLIAELVANHASEVTA